ncbi:hypothetical protein BH10BDE1_BH10BDE1_29280 [soil metagenome]
MKIKFNRFERIAGLFVMTAAVAGVALTLAVAIKRGVFESKVELQTSLATADGIREGTTVSMQGLRIGQVTDIELISANEVHVKFKMNREYLSRVRADSVVRVMRPFIIGEKILDVSVGTEAATPVTELAKLESVPTADVMDLLSGRTLGPYFELMGKMAENLKFVAESFLDPKRSKAMVKMFDDLSPLLRNASSLTKEANTLLVGINKDQQLVKVVGNLVAITNEVNRVLPTVAKESPEMLGHLQKIAKNMAILTDEVQKTLPMMQKLAPEIPRASERALEALDQTVVTLKALQKSFLLRGSVDEVRTEEALRRKQQDESSRTPAEAKPEPKPEAKPEVEP